jgi:PAS domain S-box-containing protein
MKASQKKDYFADEKQKQIKRKLYAISYDLSSKLLLIGAFIDVALCSLDYFVTPENFSKFLVYRIITAVLTIVIYSCLRIIKEGRFVNVFVILSSIITAIMIEIMILSFGGHASPYYAGMIILLVFMLGFLPISVEVAIINNLLVYMIYLVPLLMFDTISNTKMFINNNVFLIATLLGSVGWRYFNQKLLIDKLSLEYDLSQEKEQLEQYSNKLEELVAQRTKELAVSEQKYRGLFDNASDGVAVYDSNGIIVNVNRKFCEVHGFPVESLIGTNIKVLDTGKDDEEKQARIKRLLDGDSVIYEARHYRRDGETVLLEISAKGLHIDGVVFIQAFHRDISEKKRLQEQLFQSQKMESIGMLAGGLAHDFNNILSAIVGHIELLTDNERLDADARRHLNVIESSARRAGQMIAKLLKFARKGAFDFQPVDLNSVVRDTTELMNKTLSHRNVEARLELDSTIPHIIGDANQMEQVVMNLMVNAADAMPEGGTVKVTTAAKTFGREAAHIHPLLAPGSYVILSVIDSGTGISAAIKNKIFDPFFTTKEQGKGTGLGLAMVYGIVKDHKGAVTVASQVGKWTTFQVYIASAPVWQRVQPALPESPQPAAGKVLIVEDESDTLKFVSETVQSFGYSVISEGDAVHALQIFKERSDEIALVISDVFMPMIDGRDLIKNFKAIKPSVKVIAMSGYQIEDFVRQDIPLDDFLRKPFDGIDLIRKVNKLVQPKSLLS